MLLKLCVLPQLPLEMETELEKNESSMVYAVYLHDGDQPRDGSFEYLFDVDVDEFDVSSHYYAIYALPIDVDVDAASSSSFPPPEKKLKLDSYLHHPVAILSISQFPASMCFARRGTDIYMFGGWTGSTGRPSVKVHIIDIARLLKEKDTGTGTGTGTGTVHNYIREGPRLKTPKVYSIGVSLLGMIFAIPASFDNHGECAEFLDSSSNQWQLIPNPKFERPYPLRTADVHTCDVVGSSIVVRLYHGLVYELDATNPLQGWKKSTRFSSICKAHYGMGGSEVVDGLLCTWLPSYYPPNRCFEACNLLPWLEHDAPGHDAPELISVPPPSEWNIGGELFKRERRVLDIGGGRAAIFSYGFTRARSRELHFILDIVRLEKKDGTGAGGTPQVDIVPLKTFNYEIGELNSNFGSLCCCFTKMGRSEANANATPSIAWYADTVFKSRSLKIDSMPYFSRF